MKNLLTIFAMLCASLASAQTSSFSENEPSEVSEKNYEGDSLTIFVAGVKIDDPKVEFIEMQAGQPSFGSTKRVGLINYGQKIRGLKDQQLTDQSGKELVFQSNIDMLNFLYAHGWDLVSVTTSSATINNIFFLRRKDR